MNGNRVVPLNAPTQLTLNLEVGLAERYETAMDVVRKVAYGHRNPLKTIAADMDMSQSSLSRKLSQDPDDPRRFGVDDLEAFIKATGDTTVVEYLAAKYLQTESQRQSSALQHIESMLPDLMAALKMIKGAA